MNKRVLVIGCGAAGLEVAGRLSNEGMEVIVAEKNQTTGGHLNDWYKLFPDRSDSLDLLSQLRGRIFAGSVKLLTGTEIVKIEKNNGAFVSLTNSGTQIESAAVVVATGFDLFRNERKEEYGYGIYDNVISSADLEKMFRNSSLLTHAGMVPKRVGFVHCVGSRDEKVGNLYCSKLCCVTAVKQAIEIAEELPGAELFCFYMDMRMGGAHYEEIYREAQEKWGVNFIRGKVSEASEKIDGKVVVKVEDTLSGRPLKIELDLLVLMSGMEISDSGLRLAEKSGLETGENRFIKTADNHFSTNTGNKNGIFYAGTCTAPMNVTESITHARAAALEVIGWLKTVR
jgi:heterodisulfide reductase subunit A